MKNRDRILAGTALGMLMVMTPLCAYAAPAYRDAGQPSAAEDTMAGAPVLLAQAQDERDRRQEQAGQRGERSGEAKKPARRERAEEPAARKRQERQVKEREAPAPRQRAEEAAKPQPRERATEGGQSERAGEQRREREPRKQVEQRQAEPTREPRAEKTPEAGKKPAEQAEKPAKERKAPQRAQGEGREKARGAESDATRQRGSAGKAEERRQQRGEENRAADGDRERDREQGQQRAGEQRQPPRGESARGEQRQPQRGEDRQRATDESPRPENAAPVLDSQKETERGAARHGGRDGGDRDAARGEHTQDRDRGREQAGRPMPDSDRAAQRGLDLGEIGSVTAERGRRIDEADWREHRRPRDARVVKKLGDRTIVNIDNRIVVENEGRERIRRHARDVYYEELPDNRRREVVVRRDGSKVVTIRNGYGDIVRRSRIAPDGQEYVLIYAGERHRDRWVDPARDLPPLHLTIPVSEYILESETVSDADAYYEFLDQPPVEPVEQLYTIDDVRYSARVRDMVRRVDLDTINFATGSAEISDSEAPALEAVATAMQRMIDDNPSETFLIEGHTDAVGSDESNLVLSDERAESVAYALTDLYGIPPENLFTQGYGEQYLKIGTDGPERENRRVAIRRITPLVSPVANAE